MTLHSLRDFVPGDYVLRDFVLGDFVMAYFEGLSHLGDFVLVDCVLPNFNIRGFCTWGFSPMGVLS